MFLRLKDASLGLFSAALLSVSTLGSADAGTFYVATNGNDANNGSAAAPWRSIATAVSRMQPGDTTYVRSGVYNEARTIRFSRSGTEQAPIKLLNAPGASPTIDFGGATGGHSAQGASGHSILFQNASGESRPLGWLTLEGFEIRNGYTGIKFHNLHNSTIQNNWIHHNVSMGVFGGGGHHILFNRNKINHNGDFATCEAGGVTKLGTSTCNQQHGMYIHGKAYRITNNIIYDNLAFGIQVNGSPTSWYKATAHAGPGFAGATDWLIANNTLAYNNYRAGVTLWGSPQNIRVENNIFYENCSRTPDKCGPNIQGINIGGGVRGATIRNNLFYASGSGAVGAWSGGTVGVGYTESGNIVNVKNPAFINGGNNALPASPDFRLTAQSSAIGRGLKRGYSH